MNRKREGFAARHNQGWGRDSKSGLRSFATKPTNTISGLSSNKGMRPVAYQEERSQGREDYPKVFRDGKQAQMPKEDLQLATSWYEVDPAGSQEKTVMVVQKKKIQGKALETSVEEFEPSDGLEEEFKEEGEEEDQGGSPLQTESESQTPPSSQDDGLALMSHQMLKDYKGRPRTINISMIGSRRFPEVDQKTRAEVESFQSFLIKVSSEMKIEENDNLANKALKCLINLLRIKGSAVPPEHILIVMTGLLSSDSKEAQGILNYIIDNYGKTTLNLRQAIAAGYQHIQDESLDITTFAHLLSCLPALVNGENAPPYELYTDNDIPKILQRFKEKRRILFGRKNMQIIKEFDLGSIWTFQLRNIHTHLKNSKARLETIFTIIDQPSPKKQWIIEFNNLGNRRVDLFSTAGEEGSFLADERSKVAAKLVDMGKLVNGRASIYYYISLPADTAGLNFSDRKKKLKRY